MIKKNVVYLTAALCVLLLVSACGAKANSETGANTNPPEANQESTADNGDTASGEDESSNADEEILMIIDQTPKPIEGNSFDFIVNKLPEGYALAEMQWISDKSQVKNTVQEAVEHGGNGEDGFYISGDGQFMGFFYPDSMKGEEGQVIFIFRNEHGKELTWKKSISLL
ncbi:hypothetical protein [Paenibacillus harenae]|uniref:hypothetical protein n=1 Tax=Paenibacillus harenae TaxID=306543 RepID=UPI00041F2016|nr:hypothetical protein [Paenibacillus harenae]